MSSKDKKARHAALRHFLVETPGALDRVTASLGWLVVLAGIALAALIVHLLFGRPDHPPMPASRDQGENPAAALFVRDLGRLPDGRHTFDLVYQWVLHNPGPRPVALAFTFERLSIGNAPAAGDMVDVGAAPGAYADATGAWHEAFARKSIVSRPDLLPAQWRAFTSHYRINARPDQFADVAIAYGVRRERHGWFDHPKPPTEDDAHDETVQLGAVLRAHCALGVKIHNGEMRSLCGS